MRSRGFTLVEVLVAIAILGLVASVVVPVAELGVQRAREQDLKYALREIRGALDGYRKAVEEGRVYSSADASGYPPSLQVLVDGTPDMSSPSGRKLYFLRRIPRDPFAPEEIKNPASTWGLRSYASSADSPRRGKDVYDVFSLSPRVGLNGVPYREW